MSNKIYAFDQVTLPEVTSADFAMLTINKSHEGEIKNVRFHSVASLKKMNTQRLFNLYKRIFKNIPEHIAFDAKTNRYEMVVTVDNWMQKQVIKTLEALSGYNIDINKMWQESVIKFQETLRKHVMVQDETSMRCLKIAGRGRPSRFSHNEIKQMRILYNFGAVHFDGNDFEIVKMTLREIAAIFKCTIANVSVIVKSTDMPAEVFVADKETQARKAKEKQLFEAKPYVSFDDWLQEKGVELVWGGYNQGWITL